MAEQQPRAPSLVERVERRIERETGASVAVRMHDRVIVLEGLVGSEQERQAAADLARAAAPGRWIENNLEVQEFFPYPAGELAPLDTGPELEEESAEEIEALGGEIEPDFTDLEILDDPTTAMGPSSSNEDDEVAEGDEVYVPPTDPVVSVDEEANVHMLGGFSPTSEEVEVPRSALDGRPGDEALRAAILNELHEDSLTSDLEIHVHVRNGVAFLRGRVADLDEAEQAEDVAWRVPGVVDVNEDLEVTGL